MCEAGSEYRFFVTNPGTTVFRSCRVEPHLGGGVSFFLSS